ncbi:MAG: lytic transglycosylase domain-containing protein [Acidobacteria bacterium]|nr:lytic transglycosylase domain-containing protein [Acidobacteriota bacterium]
MRALLVIAFVPCLWGGEYAVLTTGFRLRAERHTADGERTRLYDAGGGYTEIPSSFIEGFEPDESAAPAAPAAPQPPLPAAARLVEQAAQRHGVHPALVESVIAAESAHNPLAVSPKGAQGLMQLMPGTARKLGVANPFDPAQNVNGGTSYLRQLLDRYAGYSNQFERAVAAYNAGPGPVDRHGGVPPYRETVDFVSRVSVRLAAGK